MTIRGTTAPSGSNFSINGFKLPIPPQNINFATDNTHFSYETPRSERSAWLRTGHGNTTLSVSALVGAKGSATSQNLATVLNDSIVPIYKMVTAYPFCSIENEVVASKTGSLASLWAWRSMSLSIGNGIPLGTVSLSLQFEYFNHKPYMLSTNVRKQMVTNEVKSTAEGHTQGIIMADGVISVEDTTLGQAFLTADSTSIPLSRINDSEAFQTYLGRLLRGTKGITLRNGRLDDTIYATQTELKKTLLPPEARAPAPDPNSMSGFGWGSGSNISFGNLHLGMKRGGIENLSSHNQTELRNLISGPKNHSTAAERAAFPLAGASAAKIFGIFLGSFKASTGIEPKIISGIRPKNRAPGHRLGAAIDVDFSWNQAKNLYTYIRFDVKQGHEKRLNQHPQGKDAYRMLGALAKSMNIQWGAAYRDKNYYAPGVGFGYWGDYIHFQVGGPHFGGGWVEIRGAKKFQVDKIKVQTQEEKVAEEDAKIEEWENSPNNPDNPASYDIPKDEYGNPETPPDGETGNSKDPAADDEESSSETSGGTAEEPSSTISPIPADNGWMVHRLKIVGKELSSGWDLVGESSDGAVLYWSKNGTTTTICGEGTQISPTGLTINISNRMSTLRIASLSEPTKQYTGGINRSLSLNLEAPGSLGDSGLQGVLGLFEEEKAKSISSSLYRWNGGVQISNSLLEAFDMNVISLANHSFNKSEVGSSTLLLNLADVALNNSSIKFAGQGETANKWYGELLDKCLTKIKLDFSAGKPIKPIPFKPEIIVNEDKQARLSEPKDTNFKKMEESFPTFSTTDDVAQNSETYRVLKDFYDSVKTAYLHDSVYKGGFSNKVVETFGLEDAVKNQKEYKVDQQAREKQLNQIIDGGLVDKYHGVLGLAKDGVGDLGLTADLAASKLTVFGIGKDDAPLDQKIYSFLNNHKERIIRQPGFEDLSKNIPPFLLSNSGAVYKDLNLPPHPVTGSVDGLNPDFLWESPKINEIDSDTTINECFNSANAYMELEAERYDAARKEIEGNPARAITEDGKNYISIFSQSNHAANSPTALVPCVHANGPQDMALGVVPDMSGNVNKSSAINIMKGKGVGTAIDYLNIVNMHRSLAMKSKFTINRAFPAASLLLIDEYMPDAGVETTSHLKASSAYWDISDYLVDARVIRSRKNPVDFLLLTLNNVGGVLTGEGAYTGPVEDANNESTQGTSKADTRHGVLRPGVGISLRLGYDNNVNGLESVFVGHIMSVSGSDKLTVECQSWATELITGEMQVDSRQDRILADASTRNMFRRLLYGESDNFWLVGDRAVPGYLRHFGKYQLAENNAAISPSFSSLTNAIAGAIDKVANGVLDPTVENIYLPIILGGKPDKTIFGRSFAGGLIPGWSDFSQLLNGGDLKFDATGQNIWDIIYELTFRHPEFIVYPVPYMDLFGARMTLFFGPPDSAYLWRGENAGIRAKSTRTTANIMNEIATSTKTTATINKDSGSFLSTTIDTTGKIASTTSSIVKTTSAIVGGLPGLAIGIYSNAAGVQSTVSSGVRNVAQTLQGNASKLSGSQEFLTYVPGAHRIQPFRKYHLVTSVHDIISNDIEANSENTANAITVRYTDNEAEKDNYGRMLGESNAEELSVKADDSILDSNLRWSTEVEANAHNMGLASAYATRHLKLNLQDLYKGSLTIVGNASIKPHDMVVIADTYSDMFGMVGVEEVEQFYSVDTGLVTKIIPDLVVNTANSHTHTVHTGMMRALLLLGINYIQNAGLPTPLTDIPKAEKKQDPDTGLGENAKKVLSMADKAATEGSLPSVGTGTLAGSILGAPIAGTILTVGAHAAASGGYRLMLAARNRQPVDILPLIKGGWPYIIGLEGLKNDTFVEAIQDKWTLFSNASRRTIAEDISKARAR